MSRAAQGHVRSGHRMFHRFGEKDSVGGFDERNFRGVAGAELSYQWGDEDGVIASVGPCERDPALKGREKWNRHGGGRGSKERFEPMQMLIRRGQERVTESEDVGCRKVATVEEYPHGGDRVRLRVQQRD